MKKLVKMLALALCLGVGTFALASCADNAAAPYITTAIARTAGSGTRSAFDELVVNSEGEALEDHMADRDWVLTAETTGQVVTSVGQNSAFLGYISLGSVAANANRIKAVKVNGVDATTENVVRGEYALSRPFILVSPDFDNLSDAAKNFISFIQSEQGQEITNGEYIAYGEPVEYSEYTGSAATVSLGGSTSVGPLMEDLAAAYMAINENVTVTVTGGGSGTGVSGAGESFDIGMASRALKAEEEKTREYVKIADDGIAVIVHKDSALTNVTFDQLFDLYVEGTRIECK